MQGNNGYGKTVRPIDENAFVGRRTASNFCSNNDFRYRDISDIRVLYNRTYNFRGQKVASAFSCSNTVARESDQALATENFYRYVTCVIGNFFISSATSNFVAILTVTLENPRTYMEVTRRSLICRDRGLSM